jgi:hypothetical protein
VAHSLETAKGGEPERERIGPGGSAGQEQSGRQPANRFSYRQSVCETHSGFSMSHDKQASLIV